MLTIILLITCGCVLFFATYVPFLINHLVDKVIELIGRINVLIEVTKKLKQ